jgi:hypothetical protein
VQRFFAPPGGPPVQPFCLTLMTATLGLCNLVLNLAVEAPRLEFIPIARGGRFSQP